jgi:hypothetical protein
MLVARVEGGEHHRCVRRADTFGNRRARVHGGLPRRSRAKASAHSPTSAGPW